MFQQIVNFILLRHLRASRIAKKLLESIESEITEEFLELLLKAMGLFMLCNKEYRENIRGFNARYLFKSRDEKITIAACFKKNKMKVTEGIIDNTNITIIFKNAVALRNFLLTPKPDILNSILKQDITLDGNLNYLYKFAFMAKRLQLMAMGKV